MVNRDFYLDQLIDKRHNGKVKIVTGIRRSGKSYLLSVLYKNYLLNEGVPEANIIHIELDKKKNLRYRNPNELCDYVLQHTAGREGWCYVFIDEIQLSYRVKNTDIDESLVAEEDRDLLYTTFYDVLNDLREQPNIDVYVTGSNSKMLSSDIVTNFRDRGSEIQVFPLSFQEFMTVCEMDKTDALQEYLTYGGMPLAVLEHNEAEKKKYLRELYKRVYVKDIVERYKISDEHVLGNVVDVVCSSVGSLTNPYNLANTMQSVMHISISDKTVKRYLDYLADACLFCQAERYDVRGKHYLSTPMKYYSMDIGLRNARLNFRQQDQGHLLENVLYIELIRRGYAVDVGMVEILQTKNGKRQQSQYEIDFVVNTPHGKVYIQTTQHLDTDVLQEREIFSLKNTGDFFRKIVILGGNQKAWVDDDGIEYVGIIPFLLESYEI